jgi:GT2 family glycosyltransferase
MKIEHHEKFIYILIPVHNRREITLRCLDHLKQQKVLEEYYVVVIDDGSTDGTSEAIEIQYPEVILIKGNGDLWWTGAIRQGMEYAYRHNADYFVWMNDDVIPSPGTLQMIVDYSNQLSNSIVSAQCYQDDEFQAPTYGGQNKRFLSLKILHTPLGQIYPCDCMSGNLVCFPISVIDKIGLPPSDRLPHNLADVVYTWNAKKSGYQLMVYGDAKAICEFNPYDEGLESSPIPMNNRWKRLTSYKSNLYPPAFGYYCLCVYGFFAPIVFIKAYFSFIIYTLLRLFLPLSLLTSIKGIQKKLG